MTEYLIRWSSGLEPDSWEPAENFADPEWISKYWKAKKGKNKKDNKVQDTQQQKTKKRGPRKLIPVTNTTLLAMLTIFLWLLSNAYADIIQDNFHYCYEIDKVKEDTKIANLESNCDKYKPIDFARVNLNITSDLGEEFSNDLSQSEITVVQKLPYEVKEESYECWKTLVTISISVNFFGVQSYSKKENIIKLTRAECQLMEAKRCDNMNMICDSMQRECAYDGTPEPDFNWLQSYTQTGSICKFKKRPIIAKDDSSKLFGTSCVASIPECHLEQSIVIWDPSIIDHCPYRNIITITGFTMEPGQILYHKERQLAFKLALPFKGRNKRAVNSQPYKPTTKSQKTTKNNTTPTVVEKFINNTTNLKERDVVLSNIRLLKSAMFVNQACYDENNKPKLKLYSTVEGLMISASKEVKNLKESEVGVSEVSFNYT